MNKKRYSFMNMKKAVGKNNNSFVGVTLECMVCNPRPASYINGSMVMNFSTPIYNRGKYISYFCGLYPQEDENGTVWAQVSCWQKGEQGLVSRLNKLIQSKSGSTVVLIVTGAIKVVQEEDNQGRFFTNVKINCDDFQLVRTVMQEDNKANFVTETTAAPQSNRKEHQTQTNQDKSGNAPNEFFEVMEEEDMPF